MEALDAVALVRVRQAARSGRAREIRIRSDLSMSEVGAHCLVTGSTVGHWESGRRTPTGEPAMRYARLLAELEARLGQPAVGSVS